jgi:hypothetical protein
MMPLLKFSANTGDRLAGPYPSGKSWMPPLSAMPKRKGPEWGSDQPTREPFITIDDCIETAQELWARLRRLGEQKHLLDVRKGVIVSMADKDDSKTVKASSRTYFFDVKETKPRMY